MELKLAEESGCSIIGVDGELDLYNAFKLKELATKVLTTGPKGLIINMASARYVDSSGVGSILYTYALCKNKKVQFFLTDVHGSVRRVIELTKLVGFLPMVQTQQEALARVNGHG
jgi:anti-sigma B factor antagonist